MVRIYRSNNESIIEGVGSFNTHIVNYVIENSIVEVKDFSRKKIIYKGKSNNIVDFEGNSFDSENELISYLNVVFEDENRDLIENRIKCLEENDGKINGQSFLARYILTRDN